MACNLAANNFAHPILTGFSMKDNMLFGCYTPEHEAVVDDALGELLEEEIVWGEADVRRPLIDMDISTERERIHGKVDMNSSCDGHQKIRQRSMLSRQIEMQASTWAPGGTLSAVFVEKQSSKGSGNMKAELDYKDHKADGYGEEGGLRDGMIPPHELLARQYAASTTKSFSVLHGAGRTLKGMDLRRLRNEVWRQTGFMD